MPKLYGGCSFVKSKYVALLRVSMKVKATVELGLSINTIAREAIQLPAFALINFFPEQFKFYFLSGK